MLRPFVVDTERNLVEKEDLLGTMCYADQLTDTIKSVPTEQACTIGLYGTWGSGKSTIIRTAKEKLEKDENSRIKMVVYDAWKYSGDSFRRMFLLYLQNELRLNTTPEMERFYTATTEEIKPNLEVRKRGAIYIGVAVALAVFALSSVILLPTAEAKLWVTLCFSILSLFAVSLGGNLFYELKVSQTKNILFAPEQFEECFRQMMVKALKKKSWYGRLWRCAREYFNNEVIPEELDKLVIVIDNLDRCESGVVYSMLTDIKTFLGVEKYDVVFVIPVDHEALKKHLFAKNVDSLDAEEFLRKFFNVVIRIKKHRPDDLSHYIHALNRDQQLGFNPNTLALVTKAYAENPRRILQMLNNLTVEQSLYDEEFAKKNETLIAACMVLREHYPAMAEAILKNDTILFADSIYEKSGTDLIPNELKENDGFYAFMRAAKYALQNSTTENLRMILTNTDKAIANLSDELREALSSFDSTSIINQMQQDPAKKTDIFIEILNRIHNAETHGADGDMVSWAECVAKINMEKPLTTVRLHDMDDALDHVYDFIPRTVTATSAICQLAKNMADAGYPKLKSQLFGFVKQVDNKKYPTYQDYIRSVFTTFTKKEDCDSLRDFAEKYMFEADDAESYEFTDTQRRYLITSTYVENLIDAIGSIKDERPQKKLIWTFENLKDIKIEVYEKLYSKFSALIGPRDRKAWADFMNVVNFTTPILKAIPIAIKSAALKTFYKYITDTRITPYGQNKAISAEVDEKNAQVLAEFCLEIYRVSGRSISINPCLITIQTRCEEYLKEQLLEMNRDGVSMIPFRKNILALETKNELWYTLIPFAFEKDANGTRGDEAPLKERMQWLYNNMEESRALDILVRLTEDEDLCQMFVSILNLHDYEALNNLPEVLLPRIISLYTPETAERFKDNNAMLKFVLQKGTREMENIVTQTLVGRLNDDDDIDGVVDVIASRDKWYATNRKKLRAMLEGKLPEDYDAMNSDVKLTELQAKIKVVLEKI